MLFFKDKNNIIRLYFQPNLFTQYKSTYYFEWPTEISVMFVAAGKGLKSMRC